MKKLIFSVLAVAAMASCSKSELVERPNGGVQIQAKSAALTISTKAPFEGPISSTNTLEARVLASKVSNNFRTSNIYHDGTMTFTDDNTTPVGFATPAYYPTNGDPIYLCGLYPKDNWMNVTISSDTDGNDHSISNYKFDGKTDVMVAAQQKTLKSEALAGTFQTLTFNHLLTKLTILVKAKDAAAIAAWGKVTDITLTNVLEGDIYDTVAATIDMGTADVTDNTTFKNVAASLPFYTVSGTPAVATDTAFASQAVELTTDPVLVAYSIVTPLVATATDGKADYSLLVKTEKNTAGFAVKVNLKDTAANVFAGNTQGKAFAVTLEFQAQEIEAKATVTEWVAAGSAEEIIK